MVSAIVAVDQNWGIGYNGKLLVSIPDDLKRFKELTINNIVIMGRKTWESLPKKPLPNRDNFVITSQPLDNAISLNNVIINLQEAREPAAAGPLQKDIFIIGGDQTYKELLPYCDRVYLTKIYKEFENVDTFFLNLDKMPNWTISSMSKPYDYEDFTYQFLQYDRI